MARTLLDILAREQSLLRTFVGLLNDEASMLNGLPSTEDLLDVTDRKNQAIDDIQRVGMEREAWLTAHGYAEGLNGMAAIEAEDMEIEQGWSELRNVADQAAKLNQANGALISTHLDHTQSRLNMLRRMQSDATEIYDARGLGRTSRRQRDIAAG